MAKATPFSPPSGPPQRLFHEPPAESKFLATNLATTTAADRPDIILMMSDHHGWEETGYNGQPLPDRPLGGIDLMPFIDGLLGPVRILIQ